MIAEIIDKIYKFWQSYPNASFIQSIVVALGKVNFLMFQRLQKTLSYPNRFVREQAASILAKIGNPQALEILIADLNNSSILSFISWLMVLVVDGRVNPQVVAVLVTVLNDSDNGLFRAWAASALARIGNLQGVEFLIAALNDSDSDVRQYAALALARIGNCQGVEFLIAALNDSDCDIRQQAALALAEIGNPQGVEILIAALNDSDSKLREQAASALGMINDQQAVHTLIATVSDSDSDVRRNAAEALGKIGNSETLAKLIQLPQIDIYHPDIFLLARTLAVRFSKEKLPFIPVYPELVAHKQ